MKKLKFRRMRRRWDEEEINVRVLINSNCGGPGPAPTVLKILRPWQRGFYVAKTNFSSSPT
ncbi:unnamed protein product [Coffea canephora]|uniref:Uncharacterized protein n=1 Tax=Coffea canephora TaxID=49390 RepID=A0A068UNP3_COFCA|nr:unnamed protein product [Coffea canephora]